MMTTGTLPPARPTHNLPEYTVSEISTALKRTVEDGYAHVRVRGEISGFKRHSSGHLYFALKDSDALLDAVCWRGSAGKLATRPEDGMEVICTGRLTTYPGRSKYQMVVEQMELAGEGALLKLLEDRKKRLAAEGLFDPARKKKLPFLPTVIGVVTSPTGAVIRDILHRLADRFPRHVLLWPVAVQGEGAAQQIADAIDGFNALPVGGPVPRPDLLIVARGGGSLEDLWAFNEEVVVRAAADSRIPLISAVGHETDTTLIDYAADYRAPTPTGAAEKAVPVRLDLLAQVMEGGARMIGAMTRGFAERRVRVEGLARGLPNPKRLIDDSTQRLDDRAERLANCMPNLLHRRRLEVDRLAARLKSPREQIGEKRHALAQAAAALDHVVAGMVGARRVEVDRLAARLKSPREQIAERRHALGRAAAALDHAVAGVVGARRASFERCGVRLRAKPLQDDLARAGVELERLAGRLAVAGPKRVAEAADLVRRLDRLLESHSYKNTLARGYAVVRDAQGEPVTGAAAAKPGAALAVEFHDGSVGVTVVGAPPARKDKAGDGRQGSLL